MEVGAIISLEQCWLLAQEWYADRGDLDWQPKEADEVEQIFNACDLTGEFWEIGPGDAHKT